MKVFYLRKNILGTGEAYRSADTGLLVPPKGWHLCTLHTMDRLGMAACMVKDGDTRYTYTTNDGLEAIDLKKVKVTVSAAKLAGWDEAKKYYESLHSDKTPKTRKNGRK